MPETTLTHISPHVYWMSPGAPDRPSLAAIRGERSTLMLDAAASVGHARLFLDQLTAFSVPAPRLIALTHWHWDHVFGTTEIGAPLIAQRQTAERLKVLGGYDWSDAALDERVRTGEEIVFCAENIKLELPNPRRIEVAPADLVFESAVEVDLGGVTCQIAHVGGDHAVDSSVMYIPEDRVLFLGDCLYPAIYAPAWYYTSARTFALLDALARFDADLYIEGHSDALMNRADFEALAGQMRRVGKIAGSSTLDHEQVLAALAESGETVDDDLRELAQQFITGRAYVNPTTAE